MLETIYLAVSVASSALSGITLLMLLIIYSDKRQRESDIDYFLPTSFYISICNLIWSISSSIFGFSPTTGRSNSDNIQCIVQSTVNMTFIKSSMLWTTVLLYSMMRFMLRTKPLELIPHYNDGYFQQVERYKGIHFKK